MHNREKLDTKSFVTIRFCAIHNHTQIALYNDIYIIIVFKFLPYYKIIILLIM